MGYVEFVGNCGWVVALVVWDVSEVVDVVVQWPRAAAVSRFHQPSVRMRQMNQLVWRAGFYA